MDIFIEIEIFIICVLLFMLKKHHILLLTKTLNIKILKKMEMVLLENCLYKF